MKCPRCGADMKEGQMYCEHCGREIQIVPEFDPALETSLHKALSDVGTQIAEKASEDSKPETDAGQSAVPEKQPSMKNRRKKRWKVFAGLFAAAALCAGMSLIFWHHTPEYRYEKAAAQMKEKSYDSAAELLELLVEQDPRNVEYLNALSSCYYFEGKLEEAKDTDTKLITFSVLLCIVIGALMALVAPLFPRLYNTTDEVRHMAAIFIVEVAMFMPVNAFLHASYFTLRSGGKTIITFLFDSVFIWVVSVPVAFCLSRFTGLSIYAIYFMVMSVDLIKCVIGFVLVKKGVWLQNIVAE